MRNLHRACTAKMRLKNGTAKINIAIWLCLVITVVVAYRTMITEQSRSIRANEIRAENAGLLVRVSGGLIRGRRVDLLDRTIHEFLGVPFAEPPVGNLRFRRPVPPANWTGVKNCTGRADMCVQHLDIGGVDTVNQGKEDCLYLNVFVPQVLPRKCADGLDRGAGGNDTVNPACKNSSKLSVLVYVHGGSFAVGAGSETRFNSTVLAAVGNIIVVTINYRLGYFGFSYSATDESPGNCGIYDIIAALYWVNRNIGFFGGDPASVTLSGNSAGAFMSGYLAYSPLTRDLFRRLFLISGAPSDFIKLYATTESALNVTMRLAKMASCVNATDPQRAIACLKQLPQDKLNEIQSRISSYFPLLDEAAGVIPDIEDRVDVLAGRSLDVLLGTTQADGSFLLLNDQFEFIENRANLSISHDQLIRVIERTSRHYTGRGQKLSIRHEYSNWADPSNCTRNLQMAGDLETDSKFVCPASKFTQKLNSVNLKSFLYRFNHRSFAVTWPAWPGVPHTGDIGFIFGHPLRLPGYSPAEVELSMRLMKHVGHFVSNGDPSYDIYDWPAVTNTSAKYMEFSLADQSAKFGPRAHHCALWNIILPAMGERSSIKFISNQSINLHQVDENERKTDENYKMKDNIKVSIS